MNTLNTVLTILGWVVAGIIVWAIWPWLLQFLTMAQYLHDLGL